MSQQPPTLRTPRTWLMIFGPGAVIASLTIGSGELVFSSRGGALFGYQLLSTFLIVCLLKWALVFSTARHLVLTGQHPFQRWATLPGPRGWLPAVFLLFAALCFPIWVAFHAGTVGTLLASITHTGEFAQGSAHALWGVVVLALVTWLTLSGGYARMERIQLGLVGLMLVLVLVSLIILNPDWGALLGGLLKRPPSAYPDWIHQYPEIAERPIWLELSTYVGVIGGSGYDYLAYVSFLRTKAWGQSDQEPISETELARVAAQPTHSHRAWIKAPLIDCSLSFFVVFVFSAVFLACGTEVLRPEQSVPSGATLLTLQSKFVSHMGSWFEPFYLIGALLAMFGTLYGTIEVAPTIVREGWQAVCGRPLSQPQVVHRRAIWILGLAGSAVLLGLLVYELRTAEAKPGLLVALLTPANLFTGVLSCGIICWLSVWTDRRFLPSTLRMPTWLQGVLVVGGTLFLILGLKAYADLGATKAVLVFAGTISAGIFLARRAQT